jgi:hypothetical protein
MYLRTTSRRSARRDARGVRVMDRAACDQGRGRGAHVSMSCVLSLCIGTVTRSRATSRPPREREAPLTWSGRENAPPTVGLNAATAPSAARRRARASELAESRAEAPSKSAMDGGDTLGAGTAPRDTPLAVFGVRLLPAPLSSTALPAGAFPPREWPLDALPLALLRVHGPAPRFCRVSSSSDVRERFIKLCG